MFNEQLTYQANHAFGGFLAHAKFRRRLEEEILEDYSVQVTIVKGKDKSVLEKRIYVIKLTANQQERVRRAKTAIESLTTTIENKLLDEQAGNDFHSDHSTIFL